jgi:DNA-binding CsgD family transcriptional regulator
MKHYRGKVRDTFTKNSKIALLASNRISAFDVILPRLIPYKGAVLNLLSAFFLKQTKSIAPNWLNDVPNPYLSVGAACQQIPVEVIVRGFIAGSMWRAYENGVRDFCGNILPDGLKRNQKLEFPIITPTTKAAEGHDEDTTEAEIIKMFNQGKSFSQIGNELKCSGGTIGKILKKSDIDLSKQGECNLIRYQKPFYFYLGYNDENFKEKYNELYHIKKYTIKEICQYFNCSIMPLQKAIKRLNLITRNKSNGRICKKTDEKEMIYLYTIECFSAEKIALKLGINIKTVLGCLKRNNIFISGSIKKYKLPSGKIIKLRGYEPEFLDYVFSKNILLENEIDFQPQIILYKNLDNQLVRYFPDFYIPKWNLIVEIKSSWTLKNDLNVFLKEEAVKQNNMKYIRIVDNNFSEFKLLASDLDKL